MQILQFQTALRFLIDISITIINSDQLTMAIDFLVGRNFRSGKKSLFIEFILVSII